jgi:hypothetical protein
MSDRTMLERLFLSEKFGVWFWRSLAGGRGELRPRKLVAWFPLVGVGSSA